MTSLVQPMLTSEQTTAWLRGLLAIAWADGHFDPEEQQLIADLTQNELAPTISLDTLEPITPAELAKTLKPGSSLAEDFLRTAVMVAVANGVYSKPEDELLFQFFEALETEVEGLEALRLTRYDGETTAPGTGSADTLTAPSTGKPNGFKPDPLRPVRDWLDQMEIHDPQVARFLCKLIPPQCPFERDVTLFGRKIVHIPPLCKLNPLYEQLVGLRFRSLSYLADECHEDVTPYC